MQSDAAGDAKSASQPEVKMTTQTDGKNAGAEVHIAIPPMVSDLRHLAPSPCEGACRFNCMASVCCMLFIGPLAVLLPLARSASSSTATALYIAAFVVSGVTLLVWLLSLRRLWVGGVCCKPPRPEPVRPFAHASETLQRTAVRRVVVICNPFGGLRQGLRILEGEVLPEFERAGVQVTVLRTQYAGHATDYARTASLAGVDALCVIGGDGSLHEVVNGLLARDDGVSVPIGLIPGGSGNSFAFTLGCATPREGIRRILAGETVAVDANLIEDSKSLRRYSINLTSWGLIGDVAVTAESVRRLGPSRYDVCGVWFIMKLAYKHVRMSIEGQQPMEGDYVTAVAMLNQHMGKGLYVTPAARMDDGLLDLVMLSKADRGALLAQFVQIPEGRHYSGRNEDLKFYQVKQCSFDLAQRRGVLNIDGEIVPYEGSIRVTCVHHAFRLFAPVDCLPLAPGTK